MIMTAILETRKLTKRYDGNTARAQLALTDVSLTVQSGQFIGVMGPSGSGKSTLLYLMGGLDKPTSGDVILNGVPLTNKSLAELAILRRREIGFVFQFFNLLPTLSAEENIAVPLLLDGANPTTAANRARMDELIGWVGLNDHRTQRPDQLSGGQQQRVALARALVHRPKILLADEPTGNLDSRTANGVLKLLRQLADQQGQTIVMVTHDAHAAAIADQVVMLRDGQIVDETPLGAKRGTQEIVRQLAALSVDKTVEIGAR